MSSRLKIFIFIFILMGICGAGVYGMYSVSNMLMTHTLQVNKTSSDILVMEEFRKKQVEFVIQVESSISVQSAGSRVVFDELTKVFDDFLASEAKTTTKINDYNAAMHITDVYDMIEGSKDELIKAVLSNRNYYRLKALADPSMSIYENAIKGTDEHISTLRTMETNEYMMMKNALTQVTNNIFIGGGAVLGVLLLMLIVLQVSVAGKLRRVAYTLEDMVDAGDFTDEVHISASGEIGSIVDSINQIISGTKDQINRSCKDIKDMSDVKAAYEGEILPLLGDINNSFREIEKNSVAIKDDIVKAQHAVNGIYEMTEYNAEYLTALSEIVESSEQELNNVMKNFQIIGDKTSVLVNTADTFTHLIQIMDGTLEKQKDIAERFDILRLNVSIEAEQIGAKNEGMLSIISAIESIGEDIVNSIEGIHEVFEEFQSRSSGINSLIQDAQLGSDDGGAAVYALQTLTASLISNYRRMYKGFDEVVNLVKQQEGHYSKVASRAAEVIQLSDTGAKGNVAVAMILFDESTPDMQISKPVDGAGDSNSDNESTNTLNEVIDEHSALLLSTNTSLASDKVADGRLIDHFGATLDMSSVGFGSLGGGIDDDTEEITSLGRAEAELDIYKTNLPNIVSDFPSEDSAQDEQGLESSTLLKHTDDVGTLQGGENHIQHDIKAVKDSTIVSLEGEKTVPEVNSAQDFRQTTEPSVEANKLIATDELNDRLHDALSSQNSTATTTKSVAPKPNLPSTDLLNDGAVGGTLVDGAVASDAEYDEPLNIVAAGIIETPKGELVDDLEGDSSINPFKIDADK